ncbi:MAG: alpha-amylase family glycosyl hydrolase [Candidatus Zixiibacteriota bacterium]
MISQDDIIYFVLTDRFKNGEAANDAGVDVSRDKAFHGGDFAGLIEKIPYFQTLGVTTIWITPVYVNITDFFGSAGYHGYWPIDFELVDGHLYSAKERRKKGSKAYLKDLVTAFHAKGLKLILDMVVNHTGYHTPEYNAYPDKRFDDSHFNAPNQWDDVNQWLYGLPDLDHDNPDVGDYFVQNILEWIAATGIDGIRMDTVRHVEDRFWYLFKSQIKTKYPNLTLLGEILDWNPDYIGQFQQKHDFDTVFDFPLCGAIKACLIYDAPMTSLARPRLHDAEPQGMLDRNKEYSNANRLVTLLDNHDLSSRIMTEILDRVGHWDRELAKAILKTCLTIIFTTRGIPQVYYGTEIGMEGGGDPDNRRDMPWDVFGADNRPTPTNTFQRDIFDHAAALCKIRSGNPAIRTGYLLTLYVDTFVYVYLREFQGNIVIVAINNGHEAMPFPLPVKVTENGNIPSRIKSLLADGTRLESKLPGSLDITMQGGKFEIQLGRKSAGVWCK